MIFATLSKGNRLLAIIYHRERLLITQFTTINTMVNQLQGRGTLLVMLYKENTKIPGHLSLSAHYPNFEGLYQRVQFNNRSLPPASAVEVIETEPFVCLCVCVCVCQLVSTLTAERINVRSRTLAQGLPLMKSWTSFMVKVKDQGHQIKKRDVYDFLASVPGYKMLAYSMTL